jgi:hypothetical protein
MSGLDPPPPPTPPKAGEVLVLDVTIPELDRVTDWYLEIRATEGRRRLVTVIEVLSPGNKLHARGRRAYLRKRGRIFESSTHLVEIDLMRAGEPMPWVGPVPQADYRILVSRASDRPRAKVHAFPLRTPIPDVPIPLLPPDDDVPLPLNALVRLTYDRARYDLSLDYGRAPVPPLAEADAAWAAGIVGGGAADA